MNNDVLTTTADILEKVADYFDAVEREKETETQAARSRAVEDLKAQIKEASGNEPAEEAIEKLAGMDLTALEAVSQLVKRAHSIDEMGGPGSDYDGSSGLTVDDAAKLTEQRLVDFCMD